jgi:vacuolar protein sorting-associated protein 13A/C
MYTVTPHSSVDYAWDFPSASNKKLRLYSNAEVRDIDILEIGNLIPFKFRTPRGPYTVSLDVRAEAGTQTLAISNYIEALSLYKPKPRRQNSSRAETSMGTEAFETVVAEDVIASLTVNLDLAGFGISLINKQLVELVYISLTAVSLEYADSNAAQTINVSLSTLQIDNQLHDALYPVVLQQTPLSNRVGTPTDLPAIQASIMALKDDCSCSYVPTENLSDKLLS